MYEKQLFGRSSLYFQYAPPLTDLDSASPEDRTNKPFPKAQPWQCSVYYYWWLFLRENEAYLTCCEQGGAGPMAALYRDFGDVRDDDFMKWWRNGGRLLFCEPPQEQIEVLLSPPKAHDNDRRVLISLPLLGDVDRTLAELRHLLKPALHDARRRFDGSSGARYPVASRAVTTALHQRWQVWQAYRLHPNALKADLADLAGLAAGGQGPSDDRLVRNLKSAKASRYLDDAKALIHNVGEGRFPDFTKPPK